MKLNGFVGLGTGKLGASVFSVNAGKQIVRQYQPIVANPSTESQVGQRAKFKLMSQLAAALAPVIAIPKDGILTPRNQFVSLNFGAVEETNGTADVNLTELKITKSQLAMIPITPSWRQEGIVTIELQDAAPANFTSVAYAVYQVGYGRKLTLVEEVVVDTPGDGRKFNITSMTGNLDLVVFAYGVIAASEEGAAKYENYKASSSTGLATLIATRRLTANDIKLTTTEAATLEAQ